jgi:PAS domain S-box-containing protein
LSFRLKTILGIALIESVLLLVLIISGLNFLSESNEKQLQRHANTTSRLFANAIKNAVLSTDLATLESFIEEILTNPDIVYTRIKSNELVLAEGGHADILNLIHHPDNRLADVTDGIFDVRVDIIEGGVSYGVIEMGLSTSTIERLLADARRWTVGIASLEVILVAIFSFVLGTYLTRQLHRLKKASGIIAESGPGHQIKIVGNDEIADVAHAFNGMSTSLQQSYADLNSSLDTQKEMVAIANHNQAELRLAAQAFESSEAMFITDADANIIRINSAFTRITGYEEADVLGQNPRILSSGRQNPEFYKEMWRHLLEQGKWNGEIYNKRKNGEIFPEYVNISAVKDEDDKVTHYVCHFLDISEQKNNEQQLRTARHDAEMASEAKSNFLATMSHEIRTPMNAVLGILGLLRDTTLDSKQLELVHTGRESGELLLTIINDILDFSKMEADKLQLEHTGFDLHRLLAHSVELLKHQADSKGLSLELILEPGLPRYAKGDPDRLRQILINLINNAIKFTPSGSITIKISANSVSNENFTLRCSVQDTGIGIANDLQTSLFEEFTMADQSHSRHHEGTGLGLAICKRLVALMHGSIECYSEPGNGSIFTFTIALEMAHEHECESGRTLDEPLRLPDANTRILLAEDNPANQMVIKNILEYADLQVDIVANGREAVEAARSMPYDIVLMDISMPEMDGMTATRKIRQFPGQADKLPIVALTAHSLSGDKERFLEAGMDDYLSKPIDRAAMLDCIARWTGSINSQAPQPTPTMAKADTSPADTEDRSVEQLVDPFVDETVLQQLARDIAPEIVPELLAFYIEDARKRVVMIQNAIKERDTKTLEFESHTLGSSSAAHGNAKLHILARKVEHLCQENNHEQALVEALSLSPVADESFRLLMQRAEKRFEKTNTEEKL